MPRKAFNGGTVATRLNGPINNATTTITVLDGSTYPSGPTPFVIAVSRGSGTEEKVLCSSRSGNVITASTRGFDGTVAQSHGDGALVEHVLDALTVDEANEFANTMTTKGDLLTRSSSSVARLAIGASNNQLLTVDSAETTGLKWSSLLDSLVLKSAKERWEIAASAATGTVNLDVVTSGAWFYTSASTGNWTLNVRGNSTTTLASLLSAGDSITVVFAATNTGTPRYPTSLTIDGTATAVTVEWQGGSAPSAGNADSVDVYTYAIIKRDNNTPNATYTVFASQVRFA